MAALAGIDPDSRVPLPGSDRTMPAWVEFRLAAPGAGPRVPRLDADDWYGTRSVLTLRELDALGVELTAGRRAFGELAGGLPPGEAELTLAQRYRLLRLWGDRVDTVTEIAAALAADDLGIRVTLVEPDGTVRHFDPREPAGRAEPAEPLEAST